MTLDLYKYSFVTMHTLLTHNGFILTQFIEITQHTSHMHLHKTHTQFA